MVTHYFGYQASSFLSHSIRLAQEYQSIYIMGSLFSCCPFASENQSQADSLSKVSTVTVDGQIQQVTFKRRGEKKLDKKVEIELKRQQSRFFKKNALFESQLINKENPFIYSSKKEIILKHPKEEHSAYFSRVKDKIRYKTNKNSTTDDDDSVGEYYLRRQQVQSHCEEQDIRTPAFRSRTLDQAYSPLDLSIPVGSTQEEQKVGQNGQIDIAKLQEKVCEGSLQKQQLLAALSAVIESKLRLKDYAGSQNYVKRALEAIADSQLQSRDEQKVGIYFLAGVHYLQSEQSSQALDYLLKAMRIQITIKGTQSRSRLVQIYYSLGQIYQKMQKLYLAKNYYSKAYRLYCQHELACPQLLAAICLKVGGLYAGESQLAEADRYFQGGLKAAEESGDASTYVQTLICAAENSYQMDNLKHYISRYNQLFKVGHRYNLQESTIRQAVSTLLKNLSQLAEQKLPQQEFNHLLATISSITLEIPQLELLKQRLRDSKFHG